MSSKKKKPLFEKITKQHKISLMGVQNIFHGHVVLAKQFFCLNIKFNSYFA